MGKVFSVATATQAAALISLTLSLQAQQAEGWLTWGRFFPHSAKMMHMQGTWAPAIGAALWWPSQSYAAHFLHHYWGLVAELHHLGNTRLVGYAAGMGIALRVPIRHRGHFAAGTGLAYLTRPYDFITNTKNVAIGTHINNWTWIRFGYTLTRHLYATLLLTHYSAGAVRPPNLGLNFVQIGLGWQPNFTSFQPRSEPAPLSPAPFKTSVWLSAGITGLHPPGNGRFLVWTLTLLRWFTLHPVWQGALGLYGEYNSALYHAAVFYEQFEQNGRLPTPTQYWTRAFRFAPEIALRFMPGRIHVWGTAGVYIYAPAHVESRVFNRLGLTYGLSRRWHIGTFIKAHVFSAEFAAALLEYRF